MGGAVLSFVFACFLYGYRLQYVTVFAKTEVSDIARYKMEKRVNVTEFVEGQGLQQQRSLLGCASSCKAHNCKSFYYQPESRLCVIVNSTKDGPIQRFHLNTSWLLFVVQIIQDYPDSIPRIQCDIFFLENVNKCVIFYKEMWNWRVGAWVCEKDGGQLLDFPTSDSFIRFRDKLRDRSDLIGADWFIGLYQSTTSGIWRWISAVYFLSSKAADPRMYRSLWAGGKPNAGTQDSYCGYIARGYDNYVDDDPCSTYKYFICQYPQ